MSKNIESPYRIGIIYPTLEMNEREWNVDIFYIKKKINKIEDARHIL